MTMMTMIITRELTRRVIEDIWNHGELDLAGELFTEDYVNHGGLIPDLIRGPEAIRFSVALYRRAFPDFRMEVHSLTTEENETTIRWTTHCTSSPPDGPAVVSCSLRGFTRCQLKDGKIAESWTIWDSDFPLAHRGSGILQPHFIV